MADGGGRQDQSSSHSEWTWGLVAVMFAAAILALWFFARAPLVYTVFGVKWLQIQLYSLVFALGQVGTRTSNFVNSVFDGRVEAADVNWFEFSTVTTTVGEVMKIPMALVIMILAYLVWTRMKGNGYKKTYKLDEFIRYQALHWKTLSSSAAFNPDVASENMAPSMRPADWMKKNSLKLETDGAGKIIGDNRDATIGVLRRQLGESWKPISKLPIHVRCIIAICITHAERKQDDFKNNIGLKLREQISLLWAGAAGKDKKASKARNEALEALIAPILKDKDRTEQIETFARDHAYIATVLIRTLIWARDEAGVLATAEFLWLKEQDRVLYYALNTAGRRRRSFIECAGVWAHYYHERALQRGIIEPKVEQAVLGLEGYIYDNGIGDIVTGVQPG